MKGKTLAETKIGKALVQLIETRDSYVVLVNGETEEKVGPKRLPANRAHAEDLYNAQCKEVLASTRPKPKDDRKLETFVWRKIKMVETTAGFSGHIVHGMTIKVQVTDEYKLGRTTSVSSGRYIGWARMKARGATFSVNGTASPSKEKALTSLLEQIRYEEKEHSKRAERLKWVGLTIADNNAGDRKRGLDPKAVPKKRAKK